MTLTQILLRLVLFAVGASCYANLNILSQLSKEPDGSFAYSTSSVVLTAEAAKLFLSTGFLAQELGSVAAALRLILATPLFTWLVFMVPSVLYATNNNLDMWNNLYMDPATESVLTQLKILTTALAWWLVFRGDLGRRKCLALVLLFLGCAGAGLSSSSGSKNTMYIEPFGWVLVLSYVGISASAGVYNEWLYKVLGKDESIHVCNARIYVVGVVYSLCSFTVGSGGTDFSILSCWRGFNMYTWALVVNYTVMGLLLAQIMKFFDSIVKLLISASSMYVSAALTMLLFGRFPSLMFVLCMGLVTFAILLYNFERIQPLLARAKRA